MATTIYWFSGTGNSLHTARSIAAGLKDESELRSIADEVKNKPSLAPGTRVGIVFPIYGCGPPMIVRKFISQLNADDISSIFGIATYAGMLGAGASILRKLLHRQGLSLNAMYTIKMPENYPPMGGPPKPEKKERLLTKAEEKIQAIIAELNQQQPERTEQSNIFTRLLGEVANPIFRRAAPRADKKFYADDKCNHCGICATVCPVNNILIQEGNPVWLHRCEQCFACLHWCPETAIQYGEKSRKQSRYHHPAVSLKDLTSPEG